MSAVTARVPKPLLYLPGGTLLEHQLALLASLPISHTFVVVYYSREKVEEALEGHPRITVVGQKPPYTLMGAIASAEAQVREPFLVLHGDNYFSHRLDYLPAEAVPSDFQPDATFLVDPEARQGDQVRRLASTGCYLLSPQVMPIVKRLADGDALSDLTGALLRSPARIREVPLRGWRTNVNRLEDLLQAISRILDQWSASFHSPAAAQGYNRTEGCLEAKLPLWISTESEVVDCCLGPNVVVGPRARVRDCTLRDMIVFPGAEIVGRRLERGLVLPGEMGSEVLTP